MTQKDHKFSNFALKKDFLFTMETWHESRRAITHAKCEIVWILILATYRVPKTYLTNRVKTFFFFLEVRTFLASPHIFKELYEG